MAGRFFVSLKASTLFVDLQFFQLGVQASRRQPQFCGIIGNGIDKLLFIVAHVEIDSVSRFSAGSSSNLARNINRLPF